MKELETDRLFLRKITLDDREDMFNNWASDPKTSEMLDWDVHESVDVTKKVIQNWIEKYENGSYNWVVELKDNHEIIGNITAVKYNEKNKTCEIGILLWFKILEAWICKRSIKKSNRIFS